MEGFPATLTADTITAVGVIVLFGSLVITRRLIWHGDLKKIEKAHADEVRELKKQRDHWQEIALRALGVADTLTVTSEVAKEVFTRLPDPGRTGEET